MSTSPPGLAALPTTPGPGHEPTEGSQPDSGGRGQRWWKRAPYLIVLALASVVFTYPFVWLISASLKPRTEVFDNALIPHTLRLENFADVWDYAPVLTWVGNSAVVGIAAATTVTISSALVAFGFAYFRFPGRNVLFGLVLATMMLPQAVTMIPVYLIWNKLGLTGTQVPLWAQNIFGSAFYIFLLRQFFLGLPRELFEAARVDGSSFFGLFWRIALPLARPALAIVFVFEIQASWNDLIRPLIYLQETSLFTVPRGLKAVIDTFGNGGEQHWEIVMAASLIATLPMIIIFAVAQKHIIEGIATQGRKG
ncbi:carbohydrate ABC transporter permease [Micromonospora sp. WMMD812]|uniref:carbohydrate ABC transporter permease n=1 Tax=Micromonospora sp. WMMD812 TaxID=3015152 RepID=UPI00248C446B|nr:carbohydrate ABC transporter permease [Micromonospora sp. WMMD812]WBB69218.1 carbohydrate ABC transporter permease [Micromonospora sp. WMMD812]